jgi:hypothetical protein
MLFVIRDFALDPNISDTRFKEGTDGARQFGDGKNLGRFAEEIVCHHMIVAAVSDRRIKQRRASPVAAVSDRRILFATLGERRYRNECPSVFTG